MFHGCQRKETITLCLYVARISCSSRDPIWEMIFAALFDNFVTILWIFPLSESEEDS